MCTYIHWLSLSCVLTLNVSVLYMHKTHSTRTQYFHSVPSAQTLAFLRQWHKHSQPHAISTVDPWGTLKQLSASAGKITESQNSFMLPPPPPSKHWWKHLNKYKQKKWGLRRDEGSADDWYLNCVTDRYRPTYNTHTHTHYQLEASLGMGEIRLEDLQGSADPDI